VVRYNANYGAILIEATPLTMTFKAYSIANGSTLFDAFMLSKPPTATPTPTELRRRPIPRYQPTRDPNRDSHTPRRRPRRRPSPTAIQRPRQRTELHANRYQQTTADPNQGSHTDTNLYAHATSTPLTPTQEMTPAIPTPTATPLLIPQRPRLRSASRLHSSSPQPV
jgi:hypothetical protein